jgi:hypothetical protein
MAKEFGASLYHVYHKVHNVSSSVVCYVCLPLDSHPTLLPPYRLWPAAPLRPSRASASARSVYWRGSGIKRSKGEQKGTDRYLMPRFT